MDQGAPPGKPQLSLWARLNLFAKLVTIVPLRLTLYLARYVFFALRHQLPARFYVLCAAIRVMFMCLSSREIQHLAPTTRQSYEAWVLRKAKRIKDPARQHRPVRDVQPLESVASAILWVGDRSKASKFVLFFHGGGFVMPASSGHFEWCWNAYVRAGAEAGVEVAVGVVQYTLSPVARFPVQLGQAAAALGALLDAGVRPADIVMGGDSAGGNLTMQLLGHLVQPHDGARPIDLAEPLAAAFMVSPWLSCDTTSPSYRENRHDMLSKGVINKLAQPFFDAAGHLIKTAAGGSTWVSALADERAWLQNLDKVTSRIYLTVGRHEVLADDGIRLLETMKRLHPWSCDVRFEKADQEAHDFILLEGILREVGDATKRMKDWFKSVVTAS